MRFLCFPYAFPMLWILRKLKLGWSVLVSIWKATAITVYEGNTYYFCKSGCKTHFDKDPEKIIEEGPMGMLWMMRELIMGMFKK